MSIFVKKSEYSKVAIGEFNNGVGWASFNVDTGAVIASGGTGSPSATIEPYKDGWYRCILTFTAGAFSRFDVYALDNAYTNTEPSSYNFTGDNTSGLFVWGADLELGAFATSYIANLATGTTTRNADGASMTGTNFSSWYNQTEGTFVVGADTAQAADNRILEASGGTSTRVVDLSVVVGQFLQMYNGTTAFNASGSITLNTPFKAVGTYKTALYGVALNGGTVATNTDAVVNTANALQIGRFNTSSNYLNGHIRFINYYSTRLPNTTLQALTA